MAKRDGSLSPQEWRVSEAFASGRTTKEVADHLCKSTSTVVSQLQSIYEKKSIPHNLNALVIWYMCQLHEIELPEFMRKAGATLLLALFLSTLQTDNDITRRSRRVRGRRTRTEYNMQGY